MTVLLLFVMIVGFLLMGVPIAVSLGLSSMLFLLLFSDTSLASIAQSFFQGQHHRQFLAWMDDGFHVDDRH